MLAQSREKIALFVFFCLAILGLGGLLGYLLLGHTWNVAATNIDDATGTLDGYVVVLYEGTTLPVDNSTLSDEDDDLDSDENLNTDDGLPNSSNKGSSNESNGLSNQNKNSSNSNKNASGESDPKEEDESKLSNSADNSAETSDGLPESDDDEPDTGIKPPSSSGKDKSADSSGSTSTLVPIPPLDIDEVVESYQKKQATVVTLDTLDPSKYEDGLIIRKGKSRFGVLSITATDTPFKIERQVRDLERYEVDFILVITPDMELVERVPGIDIVVSTQAESLFVMGETRDSTFYVAAPTTGSVGAILISPSSVVTAKVLSPQ